MICWHERRMWTTSIGRFWRLYFGVLFVAMLTPAPSFPDSEIVNQCLDGPVVKELVMTLGDRGPRDKPTPVVALSALDVDQVRAVMASAELSFAPASLVKVPLDVMEKLLALVRSDRFTFLEISKPYPPVTFVLGLVVHGRACDGVVAYDSARRLLLLVKESTAPDSIDWRQLSSLLHAIPPES